ncbi:glyoxalase superfamily protein [Saccharospirillum sp. HFRX-1]|uniref:glyoxalase superfamily protein n=1 Tax=unclassified Saccharospirillum TaxID=2633430 RepID=UPI003721D4C4
MSEPLPTLAQIKAQAKRLRQLMAAEGVDIGHSQALELIAKDHGYRDWNTLSAELKNTQPPVAVGEWVNGHYQGQPFRAEVRSVEMERLGYWRLRLQLEQPLDVVTSPRFSALRRHLMATVDDRGITSERLSSGEPLLRLQLPD